MTTKAPLKAWAVRFPDGTIHPRWMFTTKKELKSFAPGELYGDVSSWSRAKADGYRAVKVFITV